MYRVNQLTTNKAVHHILIKSEDWPGEQERGKLSHQLSDQLKEIVIQHPDSVFDVNPKEAIYCGQVPEGGKRQQWAVLTFHYADWIHKDSKLLCFYQDEHTVSITN